ncbi:MAG: hypothetical protein WA667_00910 [Candidatus Nitrosopolaris sp.]
MRAPRTGSVIETVFREQGADVGDHGIGRLISAGLAVMATNNSIANIS